LSEGNGKLIIFEKKINIGHVLTLLTVIGGTIAGVWTVREADFKVLAEIQSQQRMQQDKIEAMYREIDKDRKENLQFMSDMRSATGKSSTDMAVLQALFNRMVDGKK
jgi:hypothetical protein